MHILCFHSYGVISLFIFPTGPTTLDSEPRGRRYVKNMIYNRNRLATGSYALALGRDTKTLSWKEVEGLLFSPPKLSVGAYFELSFLGCGFLIHLSNKSDRPDSEPCGRRYVKNMIYNRNHLYSRAIHCPASMEKHYVQ